ncbi:hypothetical protein N431DRAFT_460066 [Stipitochalara longipes BDJ]|nr:hypothetical protein N431DRAFT_460066 [Stipitochalara longipes BDJ]
MHYLQTLLTVSFLQGLAHGQDYVLWFQPGAQITRLASTMLVPSVPPVNTGFHAIWPGLQPTDDSFVFQNVVDDDQPVGKWAYSTWYGPYDTAGDYYDYPTVPTTPGDSFITDFEFYAPTTEWIDTYVLEPGTAGASAGETPSSGSLSPPASGTTFPSSKTLTQALFVIELQGSGAVWNFGSLTFTNIIITADTTSTAWCNSPAKSGSFTYTMTTPVATVVNGQVDCYIAELVFVAPTGSSVQLGGAPFNGTVNNDQLCGRLSVCATNDYDYSTVAS